MTEEAQKKRNGKKAKATPPVDEAKRNEAEQAIQAAPPTSGRTCEASVNLHKCNLPWGHAGYHRTASQDFVWP